MPNTPLFEGKVAIVLGGSRGIGASTSLQLAKQGASVCVLARSQEEVEGLVNTIRSEGGKAWGFIVNALVTKDLEDTFKKIHDTLGGIDIFINLVGGFSKFIPFEEISEEEWHRVLNLNLTSVFIACQKIFPLMNPYGRIVLVGSIAGLGPNPHAKSYIPYGVAKSGLITMVKYLATECGSQKITVNCVSPGSTATERVIELRGEDGLLDLAKKNPLNHVLVPEDSAATIVFLASPQAQGITGINVNINAGSVM